MRSGFVMAVVMLLGAGSALGYRHVFAGRSRSVLLPWPITSTRVSWPNARQATGAAPTATARVDIRERMRGMLEQNRLTTAIAQPTLASF